MFPLQHISRYPENVRKEVRKLYFLKYPVSQISEETSVPTSTIWRWIEEDNLRDIRSRNTVDLDEEARSLYAGVLKGTSDCVKIAEKLLRHIDSRLEAATPDRCLKSNEKPMQEKLHPEPIDPETLEQFSNVIKNVGDTLVKIFK